MAVTLYEASFQRNGTSAFNCTASLTDNIRMEALIDIGVSSGLYKIEWKIRNLDTLAEFSFYSDLQNVVLGAQFFVSTWNAPVTVSGRYQIFWVVVYDSNGTIFWQGAPP